ncbi:MAG: magnesium chelatase subunit H [Methyloversatilis sp.]|uniref:magnesium chelatase subunit H n=1 Tax=Methyloversatilis sp. TaxID=2569862 RepID=UPI002736984E|nr:magnesium chelatase subunit H [Methyloversatilis sp.]MDP3872530.1 magnesium chelatase subunit H [Methyloversatilis sp.]
MLRKRAVDTSAASAVTRQPISIVIVTMDTHLASAVERARPRLSREFPGLTVSLHAASEYAGNESAIARVKADIASADIIVCGMLFLEDHFLPILDDLRARRDNCDAMICMASASEVVKLTRLGQFDMDKPASGPMALLKRLRGNKSKTATGGAAQMKTLRRIPQMLRFIPGTAQDVRAYFVTLQYWLGGSDENVLNLLRHVVDRGADGPRKELRGKIKVQPPIEYPEVGVYHPRMPGRFAYEASALPDPIGRELRGTVGVLVLRSYLLSGNAGHYDGVIAALEARGLRVVPAFAAGLDSRPAIDQFFLKDGHSIVDAVVSLTGFSLVGGPAYNDAKAAEEILAQLDVPYVAAHPVEFQTLDQWGESDRGLLPVESTIMVAIPELDGATSPMVFGGRPGAPGVTCTGCHHACTFTAADNKQDMHSCPERAQTLAARVDKLVALKRSERAHRKVAIVIFNFPPNAGSVGTAAYLSVFESMFHTLTGMKQQGYQVDLPDSIDALRDSVLFGNASKYGADANVHTLISAEDHVRREPWLKEIEAEWGPAPGKQLSNGSSILVLGKQFGNILIAVQPAFGYEGDPMRLLFEKGLSPTHAFSAFYRYLREDFKAHAVLHFGTHGALEFMPGKQSGMGGNCWPDRLIGDMPNVYLYASNNPSEGAIAKRRCGATLISYLTPPIAQAGLYKGLNELKTSIERWRTMEPASPERADLAVVLQAQAAALDLTAAEPLWDISPAGGTDARVMKLAEQMLELEYTLIPHGLHVAGRAPSEAERVDMLLSMADASHGQQLERSAIEALVAGLSIDRVLKLSGLPRDDSTVELFNELVDINGKLAEDTEVAAMLQALDGRYIRPAPGGDILRTPAVLPTGRNIHGFDPFRIPSAFAVKDGAAQAQRLLDRYTEDGFPLPESIAMVMWGSDNLKNEGAPIAQALALMGALPRFDSYGRIAGATLIPLEELGRPRVDVVITLSGIFRDLMPLQIKLLAEAAWLAATADEPLEMNWIRRHALAYQQEHGCTLEIAALRVYGNAEGAYGSNVNNLVESSRWSDEDEIAETYTRRKGFAYGRTGRASQQTALLQSALADVQLTYQNLDSVELGVTTVDNYFDTLGGITQAVKVARNGHTPPVYIGDQTKGDGAVRSLQEQVALETRTRMLNPKWYEGMLAHGYEGVRQIETHITNTMGWSATTGQVAPWVYQQLTQTFVLDDGMRNRLASLNPTAAAKLANRLIEAHDRDYWQPDAAMLAKLRAAGEELEDRLEGVFQPVSA